VPGPQKSSENDALRETVVMGEALFAYEESRKAPANFSYEVENVFAQSDSENISTKEEVTDSIIKKADNAHPNINSQHKVRKKSLDAEDEFLGKVESEDRDKDKPRRAKEPELISKENPLFVKSSFESEEKLGQTSFIKSDIECSSKKLFLLDITDKCQDRKDISNNYVEVPPVNDSSITKLDKVLESQFSRENDGLSNKKCEEDKHRKKDKRRLYDSKKTDKEHYRRKRESSDTEEKEKQTRSKPDEHSYKRRRSRSVETNKQNRHKQEYCNESNYRSSHNERRSPNNRKSSGKYFRYRSRSRERTDQDRNRYYHSKGERTWSRERYYQDEPQRWDKGRYYNDYYFSQGTRDGRERKSSHCDKDFDKSSQAYNNRSYKDYHCKSRWPHNTLTDVHHFSTYRVNLHHCSVPPQQSEKYSRERHMLPPVSAHANVEDSSRENDKEKRRNSKRKHTHQESSGSEMEKKCRKIDDQRTKKYKKVKKKKKSKDKHREKEYKHYDLDVSVLHFDNDNRKHKKKKKKKKDIRKLKGFLEHLDPHFQKKTQEEKEESCPPAGYLCEQYRSQGSKQPSKEEKPCGAGESKNYSSITSNEYVR
ncbi:PREDICTED: ubiquitin carboxyl-terminal hydrolase 42-like, partial [Merops nubicus]|uniref:ubiquitin carboxyl-terminal hydrolase 42-like n=1 Tax=Merops nubicus TaxID=57421 RepID=UPI0004F04826